MQIFMSYASEQQPAAESIAFSLRSRGHTVFLDRDDLPEGASYDDKILRAIDRSDLFIFLITPESVKNGRYTLTELKFARHKWRDPSHRVLPVMLAATPMADVPAYLKAVSILEPSGNVAAEVAFSAERLRGVEHAVNMAAIMALCGAVMAALCGLMPVIEVEKSWIPLSHLLKQPFALDNGVLIAIFFAGLYWWLGERRWWKVLAIGVSALVGWILCVWVFLQFSDSVQILQRPPESELSSILSSLPDAKKTELAKQIEAVEAFVRTSSEQASYWSIAFIMALSGLACFLPLYSAFAIAERSFRSLTRLVIALFFVTVSGALGYVLAHPIEKGLGNFSYGFLDTMDIYFALLYLPWLMLVPLMFSYWLVRGQDT